MTVKNTNFLVNTVPCQNQPLKLRVKCDASRHFVGRYYSSKSKDFEKAFREERDSAKALFLDRNDDFIDFITNRLKARFPYDENVSNKVLRRLGLIPSEHKVESEIDLRKKELFFDTVRKRLFHQKQINYVKNNLEILFPEQSFTFNKIEKDVNSLLTNYTKRRDRFFDKAFLNRFTHFVTFTFDSDKISEEEFEADLKMTLAHFANRRGWRFMLAKENGDLYGRLHFHGLFYIPEGQMVGEIIKTKRYHKKTGKWQLLFENSFFKEKYGNNQFAPIDDQILRFGETLKYMSDYTLKQGGKITYSRHLPSSLDLDVASEDVCVEYVKYVENFLLQDECFGILDERQQTPEYLSDIKEIDVDYLIRFAERNVV